LRNRIERLSNILKSLSSFEILSTPKLANQYDVSEKIIQTDFKEYLLPLFEDKMIYYDYSSKSYKAKTNFLTKILLSSEELALIAILKSKAKDKYSDKDLYEKVNILFQNYEDALSHSIYTLTDIEKIDKFKKEIIEIQHAINKKRVIECNYRDKLRILYPFKIQNFDGYWYLICFDTKYDDIRKYHLNSISNIIELNETYNFDTTIVEKFDNAINAWYKPNLKQIHIELFLDKTVSKFFIRKPISKTQRVIKQYEDESCEIELTVTDFMEIIPTIQKFIPYIHVIEPQELKNLLKENINIYLKNFE
jgi:predicted DNA-binding transcriptional regulator YafY